MSDTKSHTISDKKYRQMANALRFLAVDAVEQAQSGHPGLPMGMADVATVLFDKHLTFNPAQPHWHNRDRFVLSAGHGSMLLYGLGYLCGYKDLPLSQLKEFRQLNSRTAGHPELGEADIVETTTGPLGQGLANAVGMAMAEQILAAQFGAKLIDHRTFVLCGDGCLMEGISQEAINLAGCLGLAKLVVLFDDNKISIDGNTSLSSVEDQAGRFAAAGWHTLNADGHCYDSIHTAFAEATAEQSKPSFIAFRTTIGYGSPNRSGTNKAHSDPFGAEEIAATRKALGWKHKPFIIPPAIRSHWQQTAKRGKTAFKKWQADLNQSPKKQALLNQLGNNLPTGWAEPLVRLRQSSALTKPTEATRASSGKVLEAITPVIPALVGGSADLSGSNKTLTKALGIYQPNKAGRYIHFGAREHAMAAVMNGMSAHGGIIPYGGTFFIFLDYCKNSIRLAALMKLRVIFVATHDSIGVGEDGPTHQPIEQLASMRATPNLLVLRPADAVETAECWELALANKNGPSVLVLTRQALPTVRKSGDQNMSAHGGYEILPATNPHLCLMASGSEVSLALGAAKTLKQKHQLSARVVSIPCFELFNRQSQAQQKSLLGEGIPRIAIEAASPLGWGTYIHGLGSAGGKFIGMKSFGASAPAGDLFNHFGITENHITATAIQLCENKC